MRAKKFYTQIIRDEEDATEFLRRYQDGTHTQNIERSWLEAKIRILKKMRGVPMQTFQSLYLLENFTIK